MLNNENMRILVKMCWSLKDEHRKESNQVFTLDFLFFSFTKMIEIILSIPHTLKKVVIIAF